MNQKQQFNWDLYFANPQAWTLETRGGYRPKYFRKTSNPGYERSKYNYVNQDKEVRYLGGDGILNEIGGEHPDDLFMTPLTTDIPFTLEDFKTGKYDVVHERGEIAVHSRCLGGTLNTIICVYDISYGTYHDYQYNLLRLRPRPISPFTHPELYEVSNDEEKWFQIKKYYDCVDGKNFPHYVQLENDNPHPFAHLRLKDQPTIITQQQADEAIKAKYGKFKIEG